MLALSPRAVERLESHAPPWPLPKLFRLTSKGKLIEGVFRGETINTPSMLCVEDALDSLKWAESVGGLDGVDCPITAQSGDPHWLGREMLLADFPRRGPRHHLLHLAAVQDHRSMVHSAIARGALSDCAGDDPAARTGRCRLRHREPPRFAAGPAYLDGADGRDGQCRRSPALDRLAWEEQRRTAKAA